jgi:hypothetical protein
MPYKYTPFAQYLHSTITKLLTLFQHPFPPYHIMLLIVLYLLNHYNTFIRSHQTHLIYHIFNLHQCTSHPLRSLYISVTATIRILL